LGGLVDNLWPLWQEHQLALHDFVAGTRVVKAEAAPAHAQVERDAFGNPV
jgi:uncharacterized RDD family membrane protein YckC